MYIMIGSRYDQQWPTILVTKTTVPAKKMADWMTPFTSKIIVHPSVLPIWSIDRFVGIRTCTTPSTDLRYYTCKRNRVVCLSLATLHGAVAPVGETTTATATATGWFPRPAFRGAGSSRACKTTRSAFPSQ